MEIWAILFSPIIAVLVSLWISHRLQKRNDRLEIFKTLMTTRENKVNMEFVKAVNSIDVVFFDRPKVRKAWDELFKVYSAGDVESVDKKHTKLLEEMANDLGYTNKITWEHITSSYTPNWLLEERKNMSDYKTYQIELMKNTLEKSKNKDEIPQ